MPCPQGCNLNSLLDFMNFTLHIEVIWFTKKACLESMSTYETWHSHTSDYDNYCLLGHDTVQSGRLLLFTFPDQAGLKRMCSENLSPQTEIWTARSEWVILGPKLYCVALLPTMQLQLVSRYFLPYFSFILRGQV
jgi:hypothetical protein